MASRKILQRTCFIGVVLLVLGSVGNARLVGYQASSLTNSTLWSIDLETCEQIGIGVTGVTSVRAMDISPDDGHLYGVSYSSLYRFDTESGLGTLLADDILPYGAKSMSFAPDGRLFVLNSIQDESTLYLIDMGSGTASEIGTLPPYTNITAFAIDAEGRGIAWSNASAWLIEINLADGATTSLGHMSGGFEAFDYAPDGTLYATSYLQLWIVDPDERTSTCIGSFDMASSMYAFTVVPEPTTIALLGLGLLFLRRRCKAST